MQYPPPVHQKPIDQEFNDEPQKGPEIFRASGDGLAGVQLTTLC